MDRFEKGLATFLVVCVLLLGFAMYGDQHPVFAQAGTSHITSFAPLTLTGSVQALNATYAGTCYAVQVYNPSTHVITVGDSTVSATIGVQIAAGGARYFAPLSTGASWSMSKLFVFGTTSDTLQYDCLH